MTNQYDDKWGGLGMSETASPLNAMLVEEFGRRLREARRALLRTLATADTEIATLERHEAGTFGLCERCGRAIQLARLRALPATRYCLDCQRKTETTR